MYPGEYAKKSPDQPAIVMATSGETVTFAEYEARSNRLAHLFRALGLGFKDHVAIFMENNPRMLECEGAAERTGLYYTCINSYLSPEETAYIINDCQAQVVMTSAAKAEVAAQLPALCPGVKLWLMVDGAVPGFESFEDTVTDYPSDPLPDEVLGAAMLYSSGTTGQPKGILRPLIEVPPSAALALMQFLYVMWRYREGMTYLSPAPLYHGAPQASVSLSLRIGATSVIMEKFDPQHWLELVGRHRITHCQMVPTMFSRLLKLPAETRTAADVSSLEVIIHAAAPCPIPVKEQMIEWVGPILLEYYAATEANGFTLCDAHEWLAHRGTVGKNTLGQVVILDENGER